MNPFLDVIERKQNDAIISRSKFEREKEVKKFLRDTARSYEAYLLEIFSEKVIKFYDFNIVRIGDYQIDIEHDYGKNSDNITIAHYSSSYGKIKIPFSHDMNNSKLTALMKEAMRVLVKKAY